MRVAPAQLSQQGVRVGGGMGAFSNRGVPRTLLLLQRWTGAHRSIAASCVQIVCAPARGVCARSTGTFSDEVTAAQREASDALGRTRAQQIKASMEFAWAK